MPTHNWLATTTLTITDGPKSASLNLFGQYVAAGFGVANDGHGDTLITYTASSQQTSIAVPHH